MLYTFIDRQFCTGLTSILRKARCYTTSKMSNITIANLPRLSREELSSKLQVNPATTSTDSPIAVIDVRDSDYIVSYYYCYVVLELTK